MDYTAFAADIKKSKKLQPAYLFYGEEGHLRRSGADLIQASDETFRENTVRFTSSELTWPALLSELCTPSFFGGRKFVLLVDEGNYIHNEAANLKAYVQSPSPAAVLVMLSPSNKCPVTFQSKKLVIVSCRTLKPYEVQKWVQTELQRRGVAIDPPAADLLVSRAGTELTAIDGYLDTLMLYAGSRGRVLQKDVQLLVGDDSEYKVFELAQASANKDRKAALVILHGLLESGENAHTLLWRLAWQYRKMAEAKRLLGAGVRRFEVTSKLQITYYQDKFLGLVDAHSIGELLDKHQALLDADIALKTSGSGAEGAILDSLICRLSSATAGV